MKKIYAIICALVVSANGFGQWSELGGSNGLSANGPILSICSDNKNNIYAAGRFTNANGKQYVAVWNGTNWSELGSIKANDAINKICSDDLGNIYATGNFTNANGKNYVAKWDGNNWIELTGLNSLYSSPIDTTKPYTPLNIFKDKKNSIYATGAFTINNIIYKFAKFNNTSWLPLTNVPPKMIQQDGINGDEYGNIYTTYLDSFSYGTHLFAKWNSLSWDNLGKISFTYPGYEIGDVATDSSGNSFLTITSNNELRYIVKWDGNSWTQLEKNAKTSLPTNGYFYNLFIDKKNNLYAIGFDYNNNLKTSLFRWDGASLKVFGDFKNTSFTGNITSITSDISGNLCVGGSVTNSNGKYCVLTQFASTPACKATFNLQPDSSLLHHWIANNLSYGVGPINYNWNWGDSSANSIGAAPSHTYAKASYYDICLDIIDANGCKSSYCEYSKSISRMDGNNAVISVDVINSTTLTNGVHEVNQTGLSIFPNPTNRNINVSGLSPTNQTINITNIVGETVQTATTNSASKVEVNLTNLPSGLYFVSVGGRSYKFIKD